MRYWIIGLLFLLTGCLQAPEKSAFRVNQNALTPQIVLNANQKEVVFSYIYNSKENQVVLPVSLEEIVQHWLENRFVVDEMTDQKILFDVQQMQMTKSPRPILKWYIFNNEEYTLSYQIRFSVLKKNQVVYYAFVKGKIKEQLPVKSSLADKEKIWADMISRMIANAENKLKEQIPAEFRSA